jgi:hypothetical protein
MVEISGGRGRKAPQAAFQFRPRANRPAVAKGSFTSKDTGARTADALPSVFVLGGADSGNYVVYTVIPASATPDAENLTIAAVTDLVQAAAETWSCVRQPRT